MLRNICRECGAEVIRKYNSGSVSMICEHCDRETEYDAIEMEPSCPDCGGPIEIRQKCGTGYFCDKCNSLKSSKTIIWNKA